MTRSIIFGLAAGAAMLLLSQGALAQVATSGAAAVDSGGTIPAPLDGALQFAPPTEPGATVGPAPVPAPARSPSYFEPGTQRSYYYYNTANTPKTVTLTANSDDSEIAKLANEDGELSRRIHELAMKFKSSTNGEERAATEKQIAESVARQFELRQGLREKQLVELEEQVKRLRATHAERANQRDRIVSDRIQQLLREADGLGWGDVSEAGGASPTELPFGWSKYPKEKYQRLVDANELLDENVPLKRVPVK